MGLPDLAEIEQRIRRLAARIGAADRELPTFGYSEDGARPHVEVTAQRLHYVVVERGEELERRTTRDVDELLWQVFADITFSLAGRFELAHRVPGQDSRRARFAKQVELLETLSPVWAKRRSEEHTVILASHPFDDCSTERANLTGALRKSGHSDEEAWQAACEKYPLPVPD